MSHKEITNLLTKQKMANAFFSSAFIQNSKCWLGCQKKHDFALIYSCGIVNQYTQPTNINISAFYQDISQQQKALK